MTFILKRLKTEVGAHVLFCVVNISSCQTKLESLMHKLWCLLCEVSNVKRFKLADKLLHAYFDTLPNGFSLSNLTLNEEC